MARPIGSPGQARQRVLDAALELFAEHGIAGTSLQMIADRIGVTKAAVYHQFPAKGDIVLGLLSDVFADFEALVSEVESKPVAERHDLVVEGVVALMVQQRHVMSALYRDPEMERAVSESRSLSATSHRLAQVLTPPDLADAQRRRLEWTVIGAGFTRAVVDPQFADLTDDQLEKELLQLARKILGR